jgi:quercetin dioxygenase-like cupin family protein
MRPDALAWAPAADMPPGAEMAVLYGDPSKEGPFVVPFKFPAGSAVPAHSDPTDEFVTIISGKARIAFGEKAGEADAQPMAAGAFISMPAGAWHRLWTDADVVVEVHSSK